MRTFKRYRSEIVTVAGAVLIIASLGWEYARMKPDYRFIVDPWSVRGFETTQGLVMTAIAVAIIAVTVVITWRGDSLVPSLGIVGGVTVFAVALTALSGADDVSLPWPAIWGFGLVTAFVAAAAATRWLSRPSHSTLRRLAIFGIFLATFLVTPLLIFNPIFSGNSMPLWVVVLVGFLLMDGLILIQQPQALAPYRLLINGVVIGWIVGLTMSASLRSTLRRLQIEWSLDNLGAESAADLRDIQVTSGVMMVWIGGLLAFAGAVALWARRRERLEALQRSQRQLEAARESAAELGESLTV